MYKSRRNIFNYIFIFLIILIILILINNSAFMLKTKYPLKYESYVLKYSKQYGISPHLVFAIIKAESNFDPEATSQKNARGLMQITEQTGKWGAQRLKLKDYNFNDLYIPEVNIYIGCWYISILMKEFHNDSDLVIAAYNGGSGNVKEWLKNKEFSDSGSSLDKIPFKETERFLKRVKENYNNYKRLYEKDF